MTADAGGRLDDVADLIVNNRYVPNGNYTRLVQLLSAPLVRPADVGPQVTLSVEHVACVRRPYEVRM